MTTGRYRRVTGEFELAHRVLPREMTRLVCQLCRAMGVGRPP